MKAESPVPGQPGQACERLSSCVGRSAAAFQYIHLPIQAVGGRTLAAALPRCAYQLLSGDAPTRHCLGIGLSVA